MKKTCPNCGAIVKENDKFCSVCGNEITQKAYFAGSRSGHDFRGLICMILAVILVVELVIAGVRYPGFLKRNENSGVDTAVAYDELAVSGIVQDKESGTIPREGGSVTLCGVTVSSDSANLSESNDVEVSDFGIAVNENGEEVHTYEISIGGHREFEVPVSVAFPCVLSENEDVAVLHYVEETDTWQPLAAEYNETDGIVTAYFSSLSPVKVEKGEKASLNDLFYKEYSTNHAGEKSTRKATIAISDYYWSILEQINPKELSAEALKYIADPSLYAQDFEKYYDSYTRDKAETFGNVSELWTSVAFIQDLNTKNLEKLFPSTDIEAFGKAFGYVSLIMSAYQAIVDFESAGGSLNEIQVPAYNLYKNILLNGGTVYSLATGYGSIGFTLAFAGVTLVAFGLDTAVSEANEAMNERIEDVFDSYFENIAPFDKNAWYEDFREAYYKSGSDPDQAMEIISQKINDTVDGFWTDIYNEDNANLLFAAAEADTDNIWTKDNIFLYATDEQKEELSAKMKLKLWCLVKEQVMPMVNSFLIERMQEEIYEALSKIAEPFNESMNFTILEQVPDIDSTTDVCKYSGCVLAFASDGKLVKDWDVINVPEDSEDGWSVGYDCTTIGWMLAGMPDELWIYESEKDYIALNEPIRKVSFMVSTEETRIDLTEGNTQEIVWGLEKIQYAPYDRYRWDDDPRKDEGVYLRVLPDYDRYVEADENSFEISMSDSEGCSYTITGMMPGKVVRSKDDFYIGLGIDGTFGADCPICSVSVRSNIDMNWMDYEKQFFKTTDGDYGLAEDDFGKSVKKDVTLYGGEAIPDFDGSVDQRISITVVNDITYTYRAMTEAEAMALEVEICFSDTGSGEG